MFRNESITEVSGEELVKLYLTLQSFLFHTEQSGKNITKQTSKTTEVKKKKIGITPYIPLEPFIKTEESPPFINKRTWITDTILSPQNDYTLSTPKGSAFRIHQEDLLRLFQSIDNFLSSSTDK